MEACVSRRSEAGGNRTDEDMGGERSRRNGGWWRRWSGLEALIPGGGNPRERERERERGGRERGSVVRLCRPGFNGASGACEGKGKQGGCVPACGPRT